MADAGNQASARDFAVIQVVCRELADFLGSRRRQLAPAAVGLPAGTNRRTPGLRREEVALLAGLDASVRESLREEG